MDILLLSREYPPAVGGAGEWARSIAESLTLLGHTVRVITTSPGVEQHEGRLSVKRGNAPHKMASAGGLLAEALKSVRNARPDLVIAVTWAHEGIPAYILQELFGIPFIFTALGTEINRGNNSALKRRIMQRIMRSARGCISISRYTLGRVEEVCQLAKVWVVNPILPSNRIASDEEVKQVEATYGLEGRTVLFTASRLVPRKGHSRVIQCLPALVNIDPSILFAFTGTGTMLNDLMMEAQELGVADRLLPLGFIPPEELRGFFARADIYVAAGSEAKGDVEGFGISLVDAAANGTPVVATRTGGVEEAICDGKNGYLVGTTEGKELSEAIMDLVRNPGKRDVFGSWGREWVLQEFTTRRLATKLEVVLSTM